MARQQIPRLLLRWYVNVIALVVRALALQFTDHRFHTVWSHLYSFSFEQNSDWTRKYPGQEEILVSAPQAQLLS